MARVKAEYFNAKDKATGEIKEIQFIPPAPSDGDLGGISQEKLEQIDELKGDIDLIDTDCREYIGYNGLAINYKSGTGFYTSTNSHVESPNYFYVDVKLTSKLVVSGCAGNGIVNLLDTNKELVRNVRDWDNPNGSYEVEDGVAFVRLSIEMDDVSTCSLDSPESRVNSVIKTLNEADVITQETIFNDFEIGSISDGDGNTIASKTRIRGIERISVKKYTRITIAVENGYKYQLYGWDDTGYLGTTKWLTSKKDVMDVFPTATEFNLIIADISNSTINDVDLYASKVNLTGTINKLKSIDYNPPKMITLIDDDGFIYFHSYLLPIIKEMGVPITSAIIGSYTFEPEATNHGRMTWENVSECQRWGAEICSHAYNNIGSDELPIIDEFGNQVMSDNEILRDLHLSRNIIKQNGGNADCLVYPNKSDMYDGIDKVAKLAGYKYCFTGGTQHIHMRGSIQPYWIDRFSMDDKLLDLNTMKSMVDTYWGTKTTGWMVCKMHTSFNDWKDAEKRDIMLANLREWILYVQSKGITFVTLEVGANEYIF